MRITISHGWEAGYCSKGMRDFAKRYGLNWEDFLSDGIEESELLKLNNHLTNKIVEVAHGQEKETDNRF